MVENIPDMDAILAQMKEKFLESAQEKIDRLNEILHEFSSSGESSSHLQEEFRREIHSLKGMGGTFEMPLITKLCHTFEEFIEDEREFTTELINASHAYVDRLSDLIENDANLDSDNNWLDGLPIKGQAVLEKNDDSGPLVLIVCEKEDDLTIINGAFDKNNFNVISTTSPYKAYQLAFEKKPTIVIASQIFEGMDGAEFLRSLGATHQFSKAKFAMICPDRRKALEEDLKGVQLLSEQKIEKDVLNFIAIAVTA